MGFGILTAFRQSKVYKKLEYLFWMKFSRNGGYSNAYYRGIEDVNNVYYNIFSQALCKEFHPASLVDIGCGAGGVSLAFINAGCNKIQAFDYSSDAVSLTRSKGIPAQRLDITKVSSIPARGDLCICLEVAEHIPEVYASHLCQLLSEVAPVVALTAAPPGQGGHLHVNEQPREYWIELMKSFSMTYSAEIVGRLRKSFGEGMLSDYSDNLLIFTRNDCKKINLGGGIEKKSKLLEL